LAKQIFRLSLLILLFASYGFSQQVPAWEFFGGYSFERSNVREYFKGTPTIYTTRERWINLNGAEFAVTENMTPTFGGTFQLTAHTASPVVSGTKNVERSWSLLYGPRISHRMSWGTPYGHVLFGAGHSQVTVSPGPHASDTEFALAVGAGLDLKLGAKMAVRALQLQYSPMNQVASKDHKFQASAGLIFYVGQTK
jgi:opacity protein-like surface antigen